MIAYCDTNHYNVSLIQILSKENEKRQKTRKEGQPRNPRKWKTKKFFGDKKDRTASESKDSM